MRHRTVRRVDAQIDRNVWDSFVASRNTVCLILNLFAHFIKICKLFAFAMQKLSPFGDAIHKLENQRPSGNNPWAPG